MANADLRIRMCEKTKDQLLVVWLLSFILLVAVKSTSTNEITPSSTAIELSVSYSSTTDMATPHTPLSTTDLQTSNSGFVTNSNIGSSSNVTSASTSLPPFISTILSSAIISGTFTISTHTNNSSLAKTTAPHHSITPTPLIGDKNVTCSGTGNSTDCKEYRGQVDQTLQTPVIIGIACGSAGGILILVVAIAICCARKKQRLSGSKADLSSYWEDNVTLSYINGHVDSTRDYPDEMISLDNDSFLNSLDNMSFSNLWTSENAKHTNF